MYCLGFIIDFKVRDGPLDFCGEGGQIQKEFEQIFNQEKKYLAQENYI